MASLAQFRKKHPEYADISDKDLATAVHAKFYADVPIEEFNKAMGVHEAPVYGKDPNYLSNIIKYNASQPLARGAKQGVEDILATIETPFFALKDKLQPKGLGDLITNPNHLSSAERNRAAMYRANTEGIDPEDPAFKGGRLAANVAATWPVGGLLGAGAKALGATKLGTAIGTGGLKSISEAGAPFAERALDFGTRTLGGALSGGAMTGLANPDDAWAGAGIGAALPGALDLATLPIKFAWGATGPMRESWRTARGREMLANFLNGTQDKVGTLIKNATGDFLPGAKMTAADRLAAANMGKTNKVGSGIAALENYLRNLPEGGISDTAKSIKAGQEASRAGALDTIAGSDVLLDAAKRKRDVLTSPLREEAFARTDVGAQIPKVLNPLKAANEEAASKAVGNVRKYTALGERTRGIYPPTRPLSPLEDLLKDVGRPKVTPPATTPTTWHSSVDQAEGVVPRPFQYTYPGQLAGKAEEVAQQAADTSLEAGNLAKVNQAQLENLQALGIKPIDMEGFINKLEQLKNEPGSSAVTEIQNLLQRIQNKAQELVQRGGGVANVRDIDAIRKSEMANIVSELANAKGLGGDKTHMAGVVAKLKDDLVSIIDDSAGGGYRSYLQSFANLSKPINQMETGRGLRSALRPPTGTEDPAAFLAEVKRLETEVDPESGLSLVHSLSPEAKTSMYQTANELKRDVERGGLAEGVVIRDSEKALKKGNTLPGLISQAVSTGNWLARQMSEKAAGKLNEDIAMKMLNDPEGFAAKYLNDLEPTARQQAIAQALNIIRAGAQRAPLGGLEQANDEPMEITINGGTAQ